MPETLSDHASGPAQRSGAADAFDQGLNAALVPAVLQCDEQMRAVLSSQEALSGLIDKLASALETFQAQQDRPQLTQYAQKLLRARRRLKNLHQAVATINNRVQSIRSLIRKKESLAAIRRSSPSVSSSRGGSGAPQTKAEGGSTEESRGEDVNQPSSGTDETPAEPSAVAAEADVGAEEQDDGSPAKSTAALLENYNPLSVAELLKLLEWD